jgi:hypothetical protein
MDAKKLKEQFIPIADNFSGQMLDFGGGETEMRVHAPDGELVGVFPFEDQNTYRSLKTIVPVSSTVNGAYQGRGIGTSSYKNAEQLLGAKILPDDIQTDAGWDLHESKGYGKEFGISDEELNSRLNPTERGTRQMRKDAVTAALNKMATSPDLGDEITTHYLGRTELMEHPEGGKTNTKNVIRHALRENWDKGAGKLNVEALKEKIPHYTSRVKSVTNPLGALMASFEGLYTDAPAKANPEAQAKIAAAYEAMKHDPQNPEVQRAYQALIEETEQQYDDLVNKKGLKVTRIGDDYPNPYKSSTDLIEDVKKNNHMAYFPTDSGFGSGALPDENPLLRLTKMKGPDGKPMPANDLFRVVHDYYGHVDGGNKFGSTGEERAYQNHRKMFSPEAQKALATETRGQNSWVNYGPFGEQNRKNPAETKYAEQKTGLLPKWATEDLEKVANPKLHRVHALTTMAARAMGPLAVASGIAPIAADIKEGKPNTALARAVSYGVPVGAEEMTENLMNEAKLRDESPELTDPSYLRTLKNIGERRAREGKSPIVESFSGREIDTSATEDEDFLNKIREKMRVNSQG